MSLDIKPLDMSTHTILATYGICNSLSLCIIKIEYGIDDEVTTIFSDGTHKSTEKIKYEVEENNDEEESRMYFLKLGMKYYLDEFLKS